MQGLQDADTEADSPMNARRQLPALNFRSVALVVVVEDLGQLAVMVMREAPRSVLKVVEVEIIVVW